MNTSESKNYEYNILDCELESEFNLRSFGFEDFTNRQPIDYFHRKTDHTFQFVLKGEGLYEINHSKHPINQHDMFYLPPNVPLKYTSSKTNPYYYYWITLEGKKINKILQSLSISASRPVIHIEQAQQIFSIFQEMFILPRSIYKIKACVFMLLHIICGDKSTLLTTNTSKSLVSTITDYIKLNYPQSEFQINTLTSHFYISQSSLYRIFMSETGVSPKTFLTDYRMKKAYELLEQGEKVTLASLSTGYTDIYHFSKQFKKYFNIMPSMVYTLCKNTSNNIKKNT